MSLFLLTFLLLYGGMHAYAAAKAHAAFGFGWKVMLAAFPPLGLLLFGPLIAYAFGSRGMEAASRAASWVAYTWMGLLFFFTWTNLAVDGVNLLARLLTALSGRGSRPLIVYGGPAFLALAALSVAMGAYSFFEASRIRTEHLRVPTEKLPAATPRIRVVQISDVHLGSLVRHRKAAAIAGAVRRAGPDLFVATGDLVDARLDRLAGLAEIFREIRAPLGAYAVTGNHEFYAGIGPALEFTRRAGFTVLRGEAVTVGNALRIVGVDDPAGRASGNLPDGTKRSSWETRPLPFSHSSSSTGRFSLRPRGKRTSSSSPGTPTTARSSPFVSSSATGIRISPACTFPEAEAPSTPAGGRAPGDRRCASSLLPR